MNIRFYMFNFHRLLLFPVLVLVVTSGCAEKNERGKSNPWNQAEQIKARITVPEFPDKTIFWFSEVGKDSVIEDAQRWKAAADSVHTITLADQLRMGETKDPTRFNDNKYYDSQYRNDMISLHIGKPVVGQRTGDVMMGTGFVRQNKVLNAGQVEIHATGLAGSPTLHAAVLDGGVGHLVLSNTLRSYMEILENSTMKSSYGYVVPNALKYYDRPDLIGFLGTEKVRFALNDTK